MVFQICLLLVSQCNGRTVKKCGKNERYDDCGNAKDCETKCGEEEKVCRSRECTSPGACVCEQGFYRDPAGDCVTDEECDEWNNMEIITMPKQ
ncbi:hypothetical protein Y032_0112g320 [Ancylostoma ceylanicum]|uniref:TIL domain-containing protein n=1 Tax=Ancylostoma ceylanicum TaxID=53326 RepID=A0A016TD25_9BILA|nr:hypothetical protein Y032_0112g320 [Ancylostoma ceylanicum]